MRQVRIFLRPAASQKGKSRAQALVGRDTTAVIRQKRGGASSTCQPISEGAAQAAHAFPLVKDHRYAYEYDSFMKLLLSEHIAEHCIRFLI
jgi:hypothetical protein